MIYLVYGPPCAGKTTYAQQHMKDTDIIVDIDRLYSCLTINPLYTKPDILSDFMWGVLWKIMGECLENIPEYSDCYLVGGFPDKKRREQICKTYQAKEIFIFEEIDICLARSKHEGYSKYIYDWFGIYSRTNARRYDFTDDENKFYHSGEWQKIRAQVLEMDHYECQMCKASGKLTHRRADNKGMKQTLVVHHVHHLKDRPDLALSVYDENGERNLITLCEGCHNLVHPEKGTRGKPVQKPVTEEWW